MAKNKGKSKPAKQSDEGDENAESTGTGVATLAMRKGSEAVMLTPDQIVDPPKSLIVRDDLGSLDELKASIKRDGQLQNLVVRPGKAGKYELLSGHRRFTCLKDLGVKQVFAVIRTDLSDNAEALGVVMSENSPDGRSNLTPVEQAKVFDRMCKAYGEDDSHAAAKVAKSCATTPDNVRRTVKLLDAPKPVLERLAAGDVSKDTVLALQKISDPKIARLVSKDIADGTLTTRADVERASVDYVKEMQAEGEEVAQPSDKRKVATTTRVWRSKRDVGTEYDEKIWAYGVANGDIDDESAEFKNIKNNPEAAKAYAFILCTFAWFMGLVEEIDINKRPFKTLLKEEVVRVRELYSEDAEDESEEEDSEEADTPVAKKGGKKSKAKVEDTEDEESEEESEDSEDTEDEESEDDESEDEESEDEESEEDESEDEDSEDYD